MSYLKFTQVDATTWESSDWSFEIKLIGSVFRVFDRVDYDWASDIDYQTFEAAEAECQRIFNHQARTGERA